MSAYLTYVYDTFLNTLWTFMLAYVLYKVMAGKRRR